MAQETKVREEETQREYRNVGKPDHPHRGRRQGHRQDRLRRRHAAPPHAAREGARLAYAHARIKSIHTGKAREHPGVEAVVHRRRPARVQAERLQPPRHDLPRRRGALPRPADRRGARERPTRRRGSARADRGRVRGAAARRRPDRGDGRRLAARPLAHRPTSTAPKSAATSPPGSSRRRRRRASRRTSPRR